MSCRANSIAQNFPELKEQVEALQEASSLVEMLRVGWRLARALAVLVVEEVLEERAQARVSWPCCEQCGRRLESKGRRDRQLVTVLGVVKWKRKVGRCPGKCGLGKQVAPLDEALGVRAHQKVGEDLKQVGCLLAVFVPFGIVVSLLQALLGVEISQDAVWNWVQEKGGQAKERLEAALARHQAGEAVEEEMEAEVAALPMVIGGDGVMAPFRPEEGKAGGKTRWREVKVGVVARLREQASAGGKKVVRLVRRRLVAVLGSPEELGERLELEAQRQGMGKARRVAWISDGALGLWRLFEARFAGKAIGILDFYHAAQNLWSGAKVWLDGRTRRARDWFGQARHQLRESRVQQILAELNQALAQPDLEPETRAHLQRLADHLEKHLPHLDYMIFKATGLPLGSGMIESACKWLIQQRFKGVGMRWGEDGFVHLLHLRLAWVNGSFDDLFLPGSPPN